MQLLDFMTQEAKYETKINYAFRVNPRTQVKEKREEKVSREMILFKKLKNNVKNSEYSIAKHIYL